MGGKERTRVCKKVLCRRGFLVLKPMTEVGLRGKSRTVVRQVLRAAKEGANEGGELEVWVHRLLKQGAKGKNSTIKTRGLKGHPPPTRAGRARKTTRTEKKQR